MRNDEIVQNVLNIFLHYMKWKPACFWVKLAAYEAAKVTERDSGAWLVFKKKYSHSKGHFLEGKIISPRHKNEKQHSLLQYQSQA